MFDTRVKENGKIDILWYKNEYEKVWKQNNFLKKENELLKEQLKVIKEEIMTIYDDMIALDTITNKELSDDIEEL